MILISHRGNINGINKDLENQPEYLINAINEGFNVEVDVRFEFGEFFLGHDFSQYKINEKFLCSNKVWCHAKTPETLTALKKINAHYFWHQEDDYTITSKGYFWTYPNKRLIPESICVLPEMCDYKQFDCVGICSDFIKNYIND
jgi:hypothetical protein